MLEEFLFAKNLDALSIKNPRNMNQNMVNELLMTITHGRALTKLDLIGVKHINSTENYQKLCESIVCLNELKYLNLSDNSFNPQ